MQEHPVQTQIIANTHAVKPTEGHAEYLPTLLVCTSTYGSWLFVGSCGSLRSRWDHGCMQREGGEGGCCSRVVFYQAAPPYDMVSREPCTTTYLCQFHHSMYARSSFAGSFLPQEAETRRPALALLRTAKDMQAASGRPRASDTLPRERVCQEP